MRLQTGRGNLVSDSHDEMAGDRFHRDRIDKESLKRILRDMNLKITEQRLIILEVLARSRIHATAQEIYDRVSRGHPEIGFATVYRLLKQLAVNSYVTEVRMGGLPARYELTSRVHHDHLACTTCGRIVEFENPDIEALQGLVARNNGFLLTGHVLELYGLCPNCQKETS